MFTVCSKICLLYKKTREENVADFRRYIAEISCVDGDRHDFSCRNIRQMIFRDKSWEIGDLSRYIGDFGEKSAIFLDISPGQRGVNRVNALQWKSNVLQCPATVHLPNNLLLLPRGFEPQTAFLPTGLTRPYDIKCIKHIYT